MTLKYYVRYTLIILAFMLLGTGIGKGQEHDIVNFLILQDTSIKIIVNTPLAYSPSYQILYLDTEKSVPITSMKDSIYYYDDKNTGIILYYSLGGPDTIIINKSMTDPNGDAIELNINFGPTFNIDFQNNKISGIPDTTDNYGNYNFITIVDIINNNVESRLPLIEATDTTNYATISSSIVTIKNITSSKLSIYPNPVTSTIKIQSDIPSKYVIYNYNGMKMFEFVSSSEDITNVSFLTSGSYYITDENENFIGSFVKE